MPLEGALLSLAGEKSHGKLKQTMEKAKESWRRKIRNADENVQKAKAVGVIKWKKEEEGKDNNDMNNARRFVTKDH